MTKGFIPSFCSPLWQVRVVQCGLKEGTGFDKVLANILTPFKHLDLELYSFQLWLMMFWVFPTYKSLQSTPTHLKMVVSSITLIRLSANWNKYSVNELLNILPLFGGGEIGTMMPAFLIFWLVDSIRRKPLLREVKSCWGNAIFPSGPITHGVQPVLAGRRWEWERSLALNHPLEKFPSPSIFKRA